MIMCCLVRSVHTSGIDGIFAWNDGRNDDQQAKTEDPCFSATSSIKILTLNHPGLNLVLPGEKPEANYVIYGTATLIIIAIKCS
jgi:hypothetical protein